VQEANAAPSRLHSNVTPARFEESVNDALLSMVVAGGFESIDVSRSVGGGGGVSASRIVRTTVPCAPRGASQSISAVSVLGFTQPEPHAVSQTLWKTSGTQPPPNSACVITFCIAASVISPLPNAGVRTRNGSSGGTVSARGDPQLGHQLGDTIPPTRRPVW
jgi:hypothetical protein